MTLPQDFSGIKVARRLARHDDHGVSHVTVTRRLYRPASVKVGYEISFARYFYKPKPMQTLPKIQADILTSEKDTEGLLAEILGVGDQRETTA